MILSLPSFIVPGTYLENVELLSDWPEISGIELLFFTWDTESRELFLQERDAIADYTSRFQFSLHMPENLGEEHEELILLSREFVTWYVVHPPFVLSGEFTSLLRRWRGNHGNIFAIENAESGDFENTAALFPDLSVCCDTGHLLLRQAVPSRFLSVWENRLSRIHLHGLENGRDHGVIERGEEWFEEIVPFLSRFEGVLHLEVFSRKKAEAMVQLLRDYAILRRSETA